MATIDPPDRAAYDLAIKIASEDPAQRRRFDRRSRKAKTTRRSAASPPITARSNRLA